MTPGGIFLTALVMAREWERGTLESIFVTPVKIFELLLSKMIPYFCPAMFGFILCLIAARFLYGVPLLATILYLFVALGKIAVPHGEFLATNALHDKKELLSTLKDPKTKAIWVVPVFMQSIIFGYVATYDLDKVPYALLDLSYSRESAEFIARIDGSAAFERQRTLADANEIANCIDSGEVILLVSILPNFAQSLLKEKLATIQVITDGRNTMTASLTSSYVGS